MPSKQPQEPLDDQNDAQLMILSEELQTLLDRYKYDHDIDPKVIEEHVENFAINWSEQS